MPIALTGLARWSGCVPLIIVVALRAEAAQQPPPAAPAGPPAPPGGGRMVFTEPAPLDFNDHAGYVALFDGVSLKGWDGDPASVIP